MVNLIKDPKGEKIFTRGKTDLAASMSSKLEMSVHVVDSKHPMVKQLETKIALLESELEQQKVK